MDKRSESFGRLLKAGMSAVAAIEGKSQQAVEEELGALIGVAGPTLQRYKAGYFPREAGSVEPLATACVRRGLLGRLWLERFLEAARLPAAGQRDLLARLFPEPPATRERALRPNLPPPTYVRFIMRGPAYEALMSGLRSELPATLVVSLGGMGKTSLAHAAARACLRGEGGAPRFAVAVWVSDKDHPGTTNLSTALDEIARVLDYPGLIAKPFAERQREVESLLRGQPVLLVIDNAETITDGALLDWLARLPGPSRALVTSRFALPALAQAYQVELGPMGAYEMRALIADWLPRSRLRGLPGALDQLIPVAEVAGGNPKAIELALGLLQHRSRDAVIADLRVARDGVFDELFNRAWALLDAAGQRVLMALPLFPASAAAEALAYCADLSATALSSSAEQLAGLSLVDVERDDLSATPRYNAHPLVRAYAHAHFARLPAAEQSLVRRRWLHWCADVARAVGFCWDNLDRLDLLDDEHATLQAAIHLAIALEEPATTIALVEGVRYYYNVRGLWGEDELNNNIHRAAAARRLGDLDNQVLALAHHSEILSKQGRHQEAAETMDQLIELAQAPFQRRIRGGPGAALSDDAAFEYGHACALYRRAQGDLAGAAAAWRELLPFSRQLDGQKYVVNRRWLATVLLDQGALDEARRYLEESLADARRIDDLRSVTGNALKLITIDLLQGRWSGVQAALDECRAIAARHRDRRRLAECHQITAQLCLQRGESDLARRELDAALDIFTRLGMRVEAGRVTALLEESGGSPERLPAPTAPEPH